MSSKHKQLINKLLENKVIKNPYLLMHNPLPTGASGFAILVAKSNPYLTTIIKVRVGGVLVWNLERKRTYQTKLISVVDDFAWFSKCIVKQVLKFKELNGATRFKTIDIDTKNASDFVNIFNGKYNGVGEHDLFISIPAPRLFHTLKEARLMQRKYDIHVMSELQDKIDLISERIN